MLRLLSGPSGFIQFYVLLRPNLCFIFFLYIDFYVLGDNALISKTKHLCVLVQI